MKNCCIGIDFGTTKTLVTLSERFNETPRILNLGREQASMPTSAFLRETGDWEIGDDAEDHVNDAALADRYANAFKLKLGSQSPVIALFEAQGYTAYSAREITAQFLTLLRKRCELEAKNISNTVITHPVNFSPAQVEDLRWAASQAGLSNVTFVHEPIAAGLAYCRLGRTVIFNSTALVVDWGGGTLDLALVTINENQIKVHAQYIAGLNTVGGNVFDDLLWEHIRTRMQRQFGINIKDDAIAFQRMQKREIRKQKEKLSRPGKVAVHLALPSSRMGAHPRITLTKAELEQVITPKVTEGIKLIQDLLTRIQEKSLKPAQVILIGGSSRIPLISNLIAKETGLSCQQWAFSHEAVALGAALWPQKDIQKVSCHICGKEMSILPNQEHITCSRCESIYQVSKSGQLNYLRSPMRCACCGHHTALAYPAQARCHHCATEYKWDTIAQKWDNILKPINLKCHVCYSRVTLTEKKGKCPLCSMQYTRTGDQIIKTNGIQIRCACGHLMTLLSNSKKCDKCGNINRWDYSLKRWVTESPHRSSAESKPTNSDNSHPISYTRRDPCSSNKENRHQSSTNSTPPNNNSQSKEESGENKSGCLEDAINMLLGSAVLIGLTVVLSGGSPIAILVVVVLCALGFIGHFYEKTFKQ